MKDQNRPTRRLQALRRRRRLTPPGAPPGTLIENPDAPHPKIQCIAFGPGGLTETDVASADDVPALADGQTVRWINVDGVSDTGTVQKIGRAFGLHPLALEDIVDAHQRPKVDIYEEHLLIIARMPVGHPVDGNGDTAGAKLETEQVAICLGRDFVVTFQEQPGDAFDPVRRRLRAADGQFRARGADYLAYALIDAATDVFFPLLEVYGEQVEDLENQVVEQPEISQIGRIHDLKRNLLTARRAVWPQREMLNALVRDESPFFRAQTRVYLRDCYDHTIQLIDMIETYREIASGLIDIHLSSVSNRMNEVMKVLTIISTIFIPLSFIVGVYGMNFDPEVSPWNMPELGWRYGYPAVLLFMMTIAGGLVWSFWRRGWIGKDGRR
ncbi:magnesium/cobalt transporter CorA [Rhizobiaceae bacterium BDR2-2]|uniref:Magnesium transport protein CorA n=1 Tax=Ectorhizobium quercum TaxID=2965071 RepID=A0AAE3SVJ6_9HYPH|nr:magnesium/cobalt transporter CorA [Ectorhizobium quercum]MCX8997044.1 magnesium/cobalt transporter CorA [Ectorhizobium quercum]